MKTSVPALILLCTLTAFPASAGENPSAEGAFVPKEKTLSSYDMLRRKSPFEFYGADPAVVVESDPFEGYSLAGYCGGGETLTVYLLAGKERKRITVLGGSSSTGKRDSGEIRVVGIERGSSLQSTAVILEKNGMRGRVVFEEDTLRSKISAPAGGVRLKDRPGIPGPAREAKITPVPVPYTAPQPFIPGQALPVHTAAPSATGAGANETPVASKNTQGVTITTSFKATPPETQRRPVVLPQEVPLPMRRVIQPAP